MKKAHLLKTIVLSLALTSVFTTFGQSHNKPKDPPPMITTIGKKSNPIKDRPKAPSNQHLQFAYMAATHTGTFDFCNSNALYLSVEIENQVSGEVHYGSVDASYPVMEVYLEPSTYSISCTTEDGSLYAGEFEVY